MPTAPGIKKFKLLTVEQAARYLGVKRQTLDLWRSTGRFVIPYQRVGGRIYYAKKDLDKALTRRSKS